MTRNYLQELIGRQIRIRTANPKYQNYYVMAERQGGNSRNLYIKPPEFVAQGSNYDWTVFNVLPAVDGGAGISLQANADTERLWFESQNNLSAFRVPLGALPAEMSQRRDASWLPIAPRYQVPDPKEAKNSFSFLFLADQPNVILHSDFRLSENDPSIASPEDTTWIVEYLGEPVTVHEEWESLQRAYNGGAKPMEHQFNVTIQDGITTTDTKSQTSSFSWSLGVSGGTDAVKATFTIGGEYSNTNTEGITYSKVESVSDSTMVTIPPKTTYHVYQKKLTAETSSGNLVASLKSDLAFGSKPPKSQSITAN